MTSIFPPEVTEALNKMDKEKIKAAEFEAGLTLEFVSVEKVKSQYGAAEDSSIVERGILDEGEQFVYTFKDIDGDIRKLYSTSFPFLIAMNRAELNTGDQILITRKGKLKDTQYTIEKV
jgi:hypothetical protein